MLEEFCVTNSDEQTSDVNKDCIHKDQAFKDKDNDRLDSQAKAQGHLQRLIAQTTGPTIGKRQ